MATAETLKAMEWIFWPFRLAEKVEDLFRAYFQRCRIARRWAGFRSLRGAGSALSRGLGKLDFRVPLPVLRDRPRSESRLYSRKRDCVQDARGEVPSGSDGPDTTRW